jgi:hypothetical protein
LVFGYITNFCNINARVITLDGVPTDELYPCQHRPFLLLVELEPHHRYTLKSIPKLIMQYLLDHTS